MADEVHTDCPAYVTGISTHTSGTHACMCRHFLQSGEKTIVSMDQIGLQTSAQPTDDLHRSWRMDSRDCDTVIVLPFEKLQYMASQC